MEILAIIPARIGSKGVKKKNIKMLKDQPLISYTIKSAKKSKLLTEIFVSTDSLEVVEIAKKYNVLTPFIRPKILSDDNSKSIDVVIHVLEEFLKIGKKFDFVCLLQPTYPFREINLIDDAITKLIETDADSLISVLDVPHHYNPYWQFVEKSKNFLTPFLEEKQFVSRRQDLSNFYFRDGAIYLVSTDVVIKQKSFYGNKLSFIKTNINDYINIDTGDDWLKAEKYLENN